VDRAVPRIWRSPWPAGSESASRHPALLERGILIQVDPQIVLHRDAIQRRGRSLAALLPRPLVFHDGVSGCARCKPQVRGPILDHLDVTRFTVRSGNLRTPGAMAKKAVDAARTFVCSIRSRQLRAFSLYIDYDYGAVPEPFGVLPDC